MAKDPAFLFYSSDFLTGTIFFSHDQVGKYIRILCAQHQHGRLSLDQMRSVCSGEVDTQILSKFEKDEKGLFFNPRIEQEIEKRKAHSSKQKLNASMRWHKSGNAMAMPLEDENENENEIVIESKGKSPEKTWDDDHQLKSHIIANYKSILKLKQPTPAECDALISEYTKIDIDEVLQAMENHKDLAKKYKTAILTLKNWLKIRNNKTNQNKKQTYATDKSTKRDAVIEMANSAIRNLQGNQGNISFGHTEE